MKLPDPTKPIEAQDVDVLFTLCVWGEARGEKDQRAREGVAHTIMNRVEHPTWWGNSVRSVILKKWQFSSFNENDPNRAKMLDPLKWDSQKTWDACAEAVEATLGGTLDITGGATHYYDDSIPAPPWTKAPGSEFKCKIGKLNFWKVH